MQNQWCLPNKKSKIHYYKKNKSKCDTDFDGYPNSRMPVKNSDQYLDNNSMTVGSIDFPRGSNTQLGVKGKKGTHKKSESFSSVSISKPKIASTINNLFVMSKSSSKKPEYMTTLGMKHQRRSSDNQFTSHTKVRYEPLKKSSPANISKKQFTNRTFYPKGDNVKKPLYKGHQSFLSSQSSNMQNSLFTQKSAKKPKSKLKGKSNFEQKRFNLHLLVKFLLCTLFRHKTKTEREFIYEELSEVDQGERAD